MPAPTRVTVENFVRAETDMYFAVTAKQGGFGTFHHHREVMPIEAQTVVRANRDTLYSSAVFDLDASPVKVTLPDAGERFMSMEVFNEDHYVVGVEYGSGSRTYTREQIGTRYVLMGIRTFIDPNDPADLDRVHALQDAITSTQESPGGLELPEWDQESQKAVRDALIVLSDTLPDLRRAFGAKDEVDPIRHLIGTASAWGGNPERDATYLNVTPADNDGETVYGLTVGDVPVDAFWSISVYNAEGYYEANGNNAYTINNLSAKRNDAGTIEIQFGGCDGSAPNCLPTTKGWNYMVRLYRPRPEILDGSWKFPQVEPI